LDNNACRSTNGADTSGSGGWGGSGSDFGFSDGRCNVDIVEGMLPSDDFIENYLKVGRPVLMKRATLSGPTGLGVLLRYSVLENAC
jgi:hypothetical protein